MSGLLERGINRQQLVGNRRELPPRRNVSRRVPARERGHKSSNRLVFVLDDVFNAAVSRYSTGEKAKGRDIIAALRTLKEIDGREPTESERAIRFLLPLSPKGAAQQRADPRGHVRRGGRISEDR